MVYLVKCWAYLWFMGGGKKLGLLVDHWIAVKTEHKNHRFCPFCFMGNTMVSGEDVPFNQVRFAIMFRVASYG